MRGSPELLTGSSPIESVPDRNSRMIEDTTLKTLTPDARFLSRRDFLKIAGTLGTSAYLTACAPGLITHLDPKAGKPRVHELEPISLSGTFVIADGTRTMYYLAANGSKSWTEPLLNGLQVYDVAAYHNDGSLLVAAGRNDQAEVSNIYAFSGGQIKPLTEGAAWNRFPSPAYDGKKVVFVSNREDPNAQNPAVYVVDMTSLEIKKVDLPTTITPSWGPVAMRGADVIVNTSGAMIDGEPDMEIILVASLNGKYVITPLTDNKVDDYHLRLNPQGYSVAYISNDGLIHLMEVFLPSPKIEDQIIGGGVISHPVWSPNGRYIAYVDAERIHVVESGTGYYLFRSIDELAGPNMPIKPENISSLAWIP